MTDISAALAWDVADGPGLAYIGYGTNSGVNVTAVDASRAAGQGCRRRARSAQSNCAVCIVAIAPLSGLRVAVAALPEGEPNASQLDSIYTLEADLIKQGAYILHGDGLTRVVD